MQRGLHQHAPPETTCLGDVIDAAELQSRWKGLVKRFPIWRFPIDLIFDAGSWRLYGADLTGFILGTRNARLAARVMDGASDEMLAALAKLAEVNAARAGEIFKTVLFGYVSLPLAFGALLSDAAPDALKGVLSESSASIVIFLTGAVVFPVIYFCGNWRAKQITWIIDLYRAGALKSA